MSGSSDFKPRAFRPVPSPFRLARPVPRLLRWAFWTLLSVSVLQAGSLLWGLAVFDFDAYLAENVHPFELDGRELQVTPGLAVATLIIGFVWSLVVIGLRAGFTLALRRGINWVRIVVTVLFGVLLLPPYDVSSIDQIVFSILVMVLTVAGIVLCWLPPSNAFFRDTKRDRIAHKAKQLN